MDTPPEVHKSSKILVRILTSVLVIILIASAAYGTYHWQHKKVESADQSLGGLNKSISKLNDRVSVLQASNKKINGELQTAETSSNAPDQSSLSLLIDNATRFYINGTPNPSSGSTSTEDGVAVEVTIKNPASSTIYLSTENLELQDSADDVYQIYQYTPDEVPSGDVLLTDQSIAPGATVRGALYFDVENLSLSSFKLLNGTKSYSVTAS